MLSSSQLFGDALSSALQLFSSRHGYRNSEQTKQSILADLSYARGKFVCPLCPQCIGRLVGCAVANSILEQERLEGSEIPVERLAQRRDRKTRQHRRRRRGRHQSKVRESSSYKHRTPVMVYSWIARDEIPINRKYFGFTGAALRSSNTLRCLPRITAVE